MNKKQLLIRYASALLLIVVAAFSRLIPHPANFTAVAAIALFGGVYLDRKIAFVVPVVAMFVSDYVIGFYGGMFWVYGSFALIGLIGLWLKNHKTPMAILGGTLAGSIIFFFVTNFGEWLMPTSIYAHTWAGLVECFVMAIPFFRNTVSGDLLFVTAMFGAYEGLLVLIRKTDPSQHTVVG